MDSSKIRIGIVGYGNLGKGVECAIKQNSDMVLVGVFSRRDPKSIKILTESSSVYSLDSLESMAEDIDVLILCGGSLSDLPEMTPIYAKKFNVVDSFDTHAKIPEHFLKVDKSAKQGGKVALISAGWDPGLFSINRVMAEAVLPHGTTYTFWGTGVSQGHSDAVRRIEGVADARQYTVPIEDSLERVRSGENPKLTPRQKQERVCYVVIKDGADRDKIHDEIVTMPNYFADYNTTVHFISKEELAKDHSEMPHGGFVIHSSNTGWNGENNNIIEYRLQLASNPEFTSSVITAYARAVAKMAKLGESGCKTVFDIPPAYLINKSGEDIRRDML